MLIWDSSSMRGAYVRIADVSERDFLTRVSPLRRGGLERGPRAAIYPCLSSGKRGRLRTRRIF